jgi:hypothetical protein
MLRWLKTNHQALTAVGAMLVGLAALLIAWRQTGVMEAQEAVMKAQQEVMQAQMHGAVYPVIQVDGFVNTSQEIISIGVRLANNGVGPALIRDIRLTRDDVEQSDLNDLLSDLPEGYDLSWSALVGRALAPGEDVTPIRMSWARDRVDPDVLRGVAAEWDNWDLSICYCSVFEQCWISSPAGGASATPVEQCAGDGPDLFEALGEAPFDEEAEQ